jgi:hypothetical protein
LYARQHPHADHHADGQQPHPQTDKKDGHVPDHNGCGDNREQQDFQAALQDNNGVGNYGSQRASADHRVGNSKDGDLHRDATQHAVHREAVVAADRGGDCHRQFGQRSDPA